MKLNVSLSKEKVTYEDCLTAVSSFLDGRAIDHEIIDGDDLGTRGCFIKLVVHSHIAEYQLIPHVIKVIKKCGYDVDCTNVIRKRSDVEYSFQVQNQVLDILRM